MCKMRQFYFLVAVFLVGLIPSAPSEAQRYRSYSTYRPPVNRNNYYKSQQNFRNTQAIQRQNQANQARLRQTRIRTQQANARKYQREQQQKIRNRQASMKRNMQERQKKALAQQTKRLKQHRQKMLSKQAINASGAQLASLQKNIQQQQLFREQKKFKDRQKKLNLLAKKRDKERKDKQAKDKNQRTLTLASLTTIPRNSFKPVSFQPSSLKDFKTRRLEQQSKPKYSASLDKVYKNVSTRVDKANKFRSQVYAKANSKDDAKSRSKASSGGGGNKKPPKDSGTGGSGNKKPPKDSSTGGDDKEPGNDGDGKKPRKLSPIFNKAANNFKRCDAGRCTKSQIRPLNSTSEIKQKTELSKQIADGHSFEKHVLKKGEFKGLEIRTKKQFAKHIERVLRKPTHKKKLKRQRTAYWDAKTGTLVIKDPNNPDGGTAFQPESQKRYYDKLD